MSEHERQGILLTEAATAVIRAIGMMADRITALEREVARLKAQRDAEYEERLRSNLRTGAQPCSK